MSVDELDTRLLGHLSLLYGEQQAATLLPKLHELIGRHIEVRQGKRLEIPRWDEKDSVLIGYGDSIQYPGMTPLASLKQFLDRRLNGVFSMVHVLPFFPYSSDDGFSVSDFRSVNPELGDWQDIRELGENFSLLFDLVLNHMSREHLWFVNFVHDEEPGRDYVVQVSPDENLSMVVRPRSTPLLSRVRTPRGMLDVWATFSNDQIDLNYANPEVLLEFIDILLDYIRRGARAVRLDAVAFLWKEIGTSCIHLPQTHEVIKLFRTLLDVLEPGAILLTETNVPHQENISYFDQGDEANMVYQFSLPPLILHAIMCQTTEFLVPWARSLEQETLPEGCTYLNFTASHDGVGLRPLEGLVPDEDLDELLDMMRRRGGYVSMRATTEGRDRPYELNISYFDAFAAEDDDVDPWHIARYMLSQTLPLSFRGIPAVYINALGATPNDPLGVERTGMTRSINRRKWDGAELERLIDLPLTDAGQVFPEYIRRLRIRSGIKAFHPDAPQRVLDMPDGILALERTSLDGGQRVYAIHNMTGDLRSVDISALGGASRRWFDALHQVVPDMDGDGVRFRPYQTVWLMAKG
ncbi:MAG: alpha-amylase [gamma proteobacterium symbiont of Stewartia floridana]|nr:sugar phosphorylase [Candidatus Thiodiazotropha taylori]RLW53628.1 MAG: alpha-amylase [gamma proteobacterium symbiont of Stewartia floridana]MCG8081315.1 sugar phosphorylase [Candidatus Thiodiazotropha taylori]MCG8086647.1 sugar phosphorylase [Candidatus Thiodiazotropha taylori]MCG8088686.1 sugar phosphorylase [Candidatus Thiodiazotropha taylori]